MLVSSYKDFMEKNAQKSQERANIFDFFYNLRVKISILRNWN